jgi:hypothetical protein
MVGMFSVNNHGHCQGLMGRSEQGYYLTDLHLSYLRDWYSDGLQAGQPEFESWQGQDFSLLHGVHTGSGALPASYPVGTGG